MAKKPEPMDTEEIQGAIQQYVSDAQTYLQSELSLDRAKATEYYRGAKFGNEEAGRSQFICTDVRDSVLAMLPSLVRLFLPTSGHVIEYQPRPKTMPEVMHAVELADQATEMVNDVVLDQDNDGFSVLYACFKDALVRASGWIKAWWDDTSSYKNYTANNLTVEEFERYTADDEVEITKQEEHQDISGLTLYDIEYRQWRKEGYARIACTPPEEILISRDARSLEDASFVAHQTEKTDSELLSMGVSKDDLRDWGGPSTEIRQSIEEIARRGGIAVTDKAATPSERKNLWIEAYPFLPLDGEHSVLCKVLCLGTSFHIIGEPEPVNRRPFAYFCPDPEPHVLIGQSVAQRVMDLQLMKSSVMRAAADGLSQSIFPDTYYMEGVVDRQVMESTAIGKNVAVRDGIQPQQAVMEFAHEWKGNDALAMLGYLDTIKQQRIGPLPATLDPDSLQSTPEVGVKAAVQAASEQLELIARVFAATGMKQLGRLLLELLVENQPRKRIVRLRGQYVEIDPKAWDAEMDVSIHVALGTQEKLGVLAATAAKQEAILQMVGPSNPLVGLGQLRHTYAKLLELQGIQDVSKFWHDLPIDWQPLPTPPSPDPNMVLAQAETMKAQAQLAKDQADFTLKQAKQMQEGQDAMTDAQFRAAEIAVKREEMHLTDERERDKAEADVAVKIAVANAQFGSSIQLAQIDADIEAQKLDVQREQMGTDVHIASLAKPPATNGEPAVPKKKGPKVTKIVHDTAGRIAELRTTEPD